jgi:hypothetical protein
MIQIRKEIAFFKGTVSQDFFLQVFSWIIFPQAPENNICGYICKAKCTTIINKFTTNVNNTGGKFAAGVNYTSGKFATVSMTPAVNFATADKKWEQYQTAYTQKRNKIIKRFVIRDFFHLPPVSTHQWCTLNFKYIREFSRKKFLLP